MIAREAISSGHTNFKILRLGEEVFEVREDRKSVVKLFGAKIGKRTQVIF
jgi:hypothetical protein